MSNCSENRIFCSFFLSKIFSFWAYFPRGCWMIPMFGVKKNEKIEEGETGCQLALSHPATWPTGPTCQHLRSHATMWSIVGCFTGKMENNLSNTREKVNTFHFSQVVILINMRHSLNYPIWPFLWNIFKGWKTGKKGRKFYLPLGKTLILFGSILAQYWSTLGCASIIQFLAIMNQGEHLWKWW